MSQQRDHHSRYYGRPRYRGLSAVEPSGYRLYDADSVDGGGVGMEVVPPPTLFSHGTTLTATAQFRRIEEDGQEQNQTYVAVRNDEVLFEQPQARQIELGSALHLAGRVTVKPMRADNEEFFRYKYQIFDAKLNEMRRMIVSRKYFKAPNKETVSWMASLIRLFVNITVRFWRLNRDVENRMRFTRALQDFMHFQCAIESFLLAEILKSHDSDNRSSYASKRSAVFKVRNTFRIFVKNMPLYDRLYHWGFQVANNRLFDFLAQFPILSTVFAFPPSENFVGSRTLALNSMLRNLFQGTLMGRRISGNRQELVTDNPNALAQNLAAERNGFETANRQQHGTYIGRRKTNAFRLEHRLETDESVLHAFQTSPASTMINNGVEHVLNVLAQHWRNSLYQENGNFGHHRQELLDPIQTLRFHMPVVLVTLTNLRGRNIFDREVVAPLIQRLEAFDPGAATTISSPEPEVGDWVANSIAKTCAIARKLVEALLAHVEPICAGIPPRVAAFRAWLEAIQASIDDFEIEAQGVCTLVASVDQGIRLGYQLIRLTNWEIPSDSHLERAVVAYLNPALARGSTVDIPRECIEKALDRMTPRDARTLQELLRTGHEKSRAAELLVGRVRTLLHRELRRIAIDRRLRQMSMGEPIQENAMMRNDWYWIQSESASGIFQYKDQIGGRLRFKDLNSGDTILIERGPSLVVRQYIPVAEAISRAQKVYMNLELEYLKRFSYNAYMEFGSGDVDGSLRTHLRRLAVVAQLQSYELDNSRRVVLSEFLNRPEETVYSVKPCRPQNLIVIGGGPTGLVTAIHAIQSCLMSGGFVTIYESRHAYKKEAASFERAQVVRLDSRWISMLRFHLGTGFEDQFVPLRGETDAHLGNTIPDQGFVELTIKGLETMLATEAIKLRSRGLLNYYTGSGIDFDVEKGYFSKKGATLKVGDNIRINDERWRVIGHLYPRPVRKEEVRIEEEYDIVFSREDRIGTYKLVGVYTNFDVYEFIASKEQSGLPATLKGPFERFQVYPRGSASIDPTSVVLKRMDGRPDQKTLDFRRIKKDTFQLDVYDSHVLIAAGKPKNTDEHFSVTTDEPYGVCCIEGLKISMLMHLFGEKRFDVGNFSKWNMGFSDDLRSQNDQNTRLVGDFTKTVALPPIIKEMARRLGISRGRDTVRTVWVKYIEKTIAEEGVDHAGMVDNFNRKFRELVQRAKHTEDIVAARLTHDGGRSIPPARLGFQRQRLQTRYFEVGDNFYLGMEFPREFDTWKRTAINDIIPSPQHKGLRRKLRSIFDRLWFEATIEVVNLADVFNPDGRINIPTFYLIPSLTHSKLGDLLVGEAFTLASPDGAKFSITLREGHFVHLVAPNRLSFVLPTGTKVRAEDGTVRTIGEVGIQMVEPIDVFEIISKASVRGFSLVRTSEGCVFELPDIIPVWRQSDLARAPDGISESKVALDTFPVSLKVNVRTMRVLRLEGNDGYITAFIGDAQASPHFMNYSGLTGACVNAMSFNNLVSQAVAGVNFAVRVRRYALETNWSNGEVVERGTGHNFGEDGFCRPGFTYKSLIDYVYSRVEEHFILGEDLESALTRDWKYKLSSGLVPRGLENDSLFRDALFEQLLMTVKSKLIDKTEEILDVEELDGPIQHSIEAAIKEIGKSFTGGFGTDLSATAFRNLDPYTADTLLSIGTIARGTVEALKQSIDYAFELRTENARVSSELFHQPKPVDSFIDDFALEAQMFANGLTQSVAFAAGSLALTLFGSDQESPRLFSIVLGALNIDTAFGTMANVSRYRNRNEDVRVIFFDEKLPRIMKGVFSLMSMEKRCDPTIPNPFVEELEQRIQECFQKARYYGYTDTQLADFRKEYQDLVSTIQSHRSVVHFMKRLLKYYIAEKFQDNPYLKDELVGIFKVLNEMLYLMRQRHTGGKVSGAFELYQLLLAFRPRLEQSLQRGTIRFGFLKRRPWQQWSAFVGIRYILSSVGLWRTMSTETRKVLDKLEAVSAAGEGVFLRREVRDFQELYYAGRESEITSLLFSSAAVTFWATFFLTLFNIIALGSPVTPEGELEWETMQVLLDLSGFTTIFSIFGATLATFHQWRKVRILGDLHKRLGQGRKIEGRLELVRYLTTAEQILSCFRILITCAAAVSLIWTLCLRISQKGDEELDQTPVYIAAIAVAAGILTVVLFFILELAVRYGLDPQLGPLVLEPFMDEIQALKRRFVDPRAGVDIETQQNVDREVWEYTAREFIHQYRFDAVFSADRFGSIFQYLQAGAPRR